MHRRRSQKSWCRWLRWDKETTGKHLDALQQKHPRAACINKLWVTKWRRFKHKPNFTSEPVYFHGSLQFLHRNCLLSVANAFFSSANLPHQRPMIGSYLVHSLSPYNQSGRYTGNYLSVECRLLHSDMGCWHNQCTLKSKEKIHSVHSWFWIYIHNLTTNMIFLKVLSQH